MTREKLRAAFTEDWASGGGRNWRGYNEALDALLAAERERCALACDDLERRLHLPDHPAASLAPYLAFAANTLAARIRALK